MNYLKKGFKLSLKRIKEHKRLFLGLILLQLIFIIILSLVTFNYQVKIMENAQEIIIAMESANYEQESLMTGKPFLQDITTFYKHYQSLKNNVLALLFSSLIIFITINGLIWMGTLALLQQKKGTLKERIKLRVKQWIKYALSSSFLFVFFLAVSYLFIKEILTKEATPNLSLQLNIFLGLFLVTYYFILITGTFIAIPSWKNFIKKIILCSIKKIHKTVLALLVISIPLALGIYLTYQALLQENNFYIILSGLLIVIIIVTTRIFWISSLNYLAQEK